MQPGPMIVRICSSCEKFFTEQTLLSGNTCGAALWTDGWMEAPMLPDTPWLVKCPHCSELLWMNEQAEAGDQFTLTWKSIFKDTAPAPILPLRNDYLALAAMSGLSPNKMRYLRMRAWWAGNDLRRKKKEPGSLPPIEQENLRALLPMLDESDENDRLSKAEAYRELGEFVEAEALLDFKFDENMAKSAAQIRALAGDGDLSVRMLAV